MNPMQMIQLGTTGSKLHIGCNGEDFVGANRCITDIDVESIENGTPVQSCRYRLISFQAIWMILYAART